MPLNEKFQKLPVKGPAQLAYERMMATPIPKAKPKPKPMAVAPIPDDVAAAAEANPESLRGRWSARGTNGEVVLGRPQPAALLIERERQMIHNEMEARWAARHSPPLVQRDYDPIRRFEEGLPE
jgi:hypothetical protein